MIFLSGVASRGAGDKTRGDTLCECGHPRRVHVYCSDTYPDLCDHADPYPVDREPNDPLEGVCMCLEFRAEGAGSSQETHGQ